MCSKTAPKMSKNCPKTDSRASKIHPRPRTFATGMTLNFRVSTFSRFVVFFVTLESLLSQFLSSFFYSFYRKWPFVRLCFVRAEWFFSARVLAKLLFPTEGSPRKATFIFFSSCAFAVAEKRSLRRTGEKSYLLPSPPVPLLLAELFFRL